MLESGTAADVAALGRRKSTTTLLACYITADHGKMRRALARRRVIDEAPVESTNGEHATQV